MSLHDLSAPLPPILGRRRSVEADAAGLAGRDAQAARRQSSADIPSARSSLGIAPEPWRQTALGRKPSDCMPPVPEPSLASAAAGRRSLVAHRAPGAGDVLDGPPRPRLPHVVQRAWAINRGRKDAERFGSAPPQLSARAGARHEPAAADTLDSIRAVLHSSPRKETGGAASGSNPSEDETWKPGSFDMCVAKIRREMHDVRRASAEAAEGVDLERGWSDEVSEALVVQFAAERCSE